MPETYLPTRIKGEIISFPPPGRLNAATRANRADLLCEIEFGVKPGQNFDMRIYDKQIILSVSSEDFLRVRKLLDGFNDRQSMIEYCIPWRVHTTNGVL